MAGILDYLRWRGDLTFDQFKFNSLDAGLLASIIYLPVDPSAVGHNLKEVAQSLQKLASFKEQMDELTKEELSLLPYADRIGQIEILDWVNRHEKTPHPLQFTAAAFRITDDSICVAYQGTDSSMIGWQEDMHMNFMPEIYGQNVAANYLSKIAERFPKDKIYLVGHSKGGNFAQYALGAVSPEIQARVIKAYNFDGPGFYPSVFNDPGFQNVMDKMKTYLPESSVIGTMLDHPEPVLIIKSSYPMKQQHDIRLWSVGRDSFVMAEGLSNGARILRHALIHFNHTIPENKRSEMIAAVFDAFENSEISDVSQLTAHKLLGTYRLSKVIMSLDPATRSLITSMFNDIWNTYRANANLPFIDGEFQHYPKSNDSRKAPVFFQFYDRNTPNLPIPDIDKNK